MEKGENLENTQNTQPSDRPPIVLSAKDKIGCAAALLLFLTLVGLLIYGWWYFVKMGR